MTAGDSRDPAPGFPLRVGVVDMGSNAIRVLAAEFIAPRTYTELLAERMPVRLGGGVHRTGRLSDAAHQAAVQVMVRFAAVLDQLEIAHYRAVATSAVRESANGGALVRQVKAETGLRLEAISGVEEARLVHWAARDRLPIGADPWVMADLGGGSLEVALVDGDGVLTSQSHTIGTVRLLEELGSTGEHKAFRTLVDEYLGGLTIARLGGDSEVAGFYATGGNMEDLAGLAKAETNPEGARIVPLKSLEALVQRLWETSFEERVEKLGLREDRADVILPAGLVYSRLARMFGVDRIFVPGVGVKEGVMMDMVDRLTEQTNYSARHARDVRSGAVALGRRFMFDEAHAVQVARLADRLFEDLATVHELGPEDREILLAAGILHDIGQQIDYRQHHKHSYYLISSSDLPGLTGEQVELVANVARYHRKADPSPKHDHFAALDKDEQKRVTRMAAILRMADALDREHLQKVGDVRAVEAKRAVLLELDGEGDLALERWAIGRKAALFESEFGVEVRCGEPS